MVYNMYNNKWVTMRDPIIVTKKKKSRVINVVVIMLLLYFDVGVR